jgi:hypothetical protein
MKKQGSLGRSLLTFVGLLAMGLFVGCSSSDDGGAGAQAGVVRVSLTDAPACGYDAVWITVSKVRIHQSDTDNDNAAGWTDITLNPPRKINLLNLNDPTQPNFALDNLGEASLPAGHYTQVRLVLAPNPNGNGQPLANSVVLSGTTTEIELQTPSGIQSGVKLIHQFDVGSGQRVDLLLDFDACKSIVLTGNGTYKLKPVIQVIPYVLNGIDGFIDTSVFADQTINNNVNHVVVTAQVNGEVVRATVPNSNSTPNPHRGKFFLARLTPGNYDVVITADGRAIKVITGVPVPTNISITTISTTSAPFTLANSATQSISGTVTLNPGDDDGTVIVAAKQALNAGPTVTVKQRVASVLSSATPIGDYAYDLTLLPNAKPWLGSYSTLLPISFTEQPVAVAGAYTIHGSAQTPTTTYTTQVPSPLSVNIAGGDQPNQNFTLAP